MESSPCNKYSKNRKHITIVYKTSSWLTIQLLYNYFKTIHGRGPKLGSLSYVPLMSFNNLISGIFEKKTFLNFYGQKCTGASLISAIFGTFSAMKIEKKLKIP